MRKPFLQPRQTNDSYKSNALSSSSVSANNEQREILTVSQLNRKSKSLLESQIATIWLEGEISNFIRAASGHWYFTLKDNSAQIKCAFFKFKNRLVNLSPKEGDKVVIKGKVTLYEARGDYQLIADYMEPAGLGDLQQELNALIKKLESQGLFSPESKRPLPYLPKRIGVITSPSGAAIHDVLTVLQRRCPMVPVVIYPTQVQGNPAATSIIKALETAQVRNECDVLLMTRGGGSMEDLWCFNNEQLAQKIFECKIPLVAAVGHEVDVTVTELVADLRAATPSAAAELLVPEQQTLWQKVDLLAQDMTSIIQAKLREEQNRLNIARLKLKDPERTIQQAANSLQQLKNRLAKAFTLLINNKTKELAELKNQLQTVHPRQKLEDNRHQLNLLETKLKNGVEKILQKKLNRLALQSNQLNAMSPLSTLGRGYSIARDKQTKEVISKKEQTSKGQALTLILSDGEIACRVS